VYGCMVPYTAYIIKTEIVVLVETNTLLETIIKESAVTNEEIYKVFAYRDMRSSCDCKKKVQYVIAVKLK